VLGWGELGAADAPAWEGLADVLGWGNWGNKFSPRSIDGDNEGEGGSKEEGEIASPRFSKSISSSESLILLSV